MTMEAEQLLEGSIDTHCHGYPETTFDNVEALRLAAVARMKGIVFKSHMWPTMDYVHRLKGEVDGIEAWSSITLNITSGGFNPWATEAAIKQGAKVIWFPTWSARNDLRKNAFSRFMKSRLPTLNRFGPDDGLSVFNDLGDLDRNVKEILALAKDHDVAVFTGHISPDESLAVAREAKNMGFEKLLISHPYGRSVGASTEHLKAIAGMGFLMEYTCLSLMPNKTPVSMAEVCKRIRDIGARHWVLSSDAFQSSPPPSEMMRSFIEMLLNEGMTAGEVNLMARKNPGELLDA